MSYLNWKETDHAIQLRELSSEPVLKMELTLEWDSDELAAFLESFEALEFLAHQAINEELRMALSDQWILFWKLREFGSRALLAHPDSDDWVGTIALTEKDADLWMRALMGLTVGQSISLQETLQLESMTNFNLVIALKANTPVTEDF